MLTFIIDRLLFAVLDNLFNGLFFICACEPSGDLYASLFVKKLKSETYNKNLKIFGVGGENLREAGISLIYDYKNLKTFGFSSGFFSALRNYKMYKKIARAVYKIRPKTFIAVSYPGINLLLCRYAKRLGIRVWYLLPPQVWAWGEFRRYFIKKWVDLVISIFPFEYYFYNFKNIRTIYWTNPLFGELVRYKRADYKKRIGFMPGSRISEIRRNLPVVIGIIRNLKLLPQFKNFEFMIILHPDSLTFKIFDQLKNEFSFVKLVFENHYQAMCDADFLVTCSGTASLETSIMGVSQIFFNRPSFIDYHILRHFLKIKEFNLVNLSLRRKMVPTFVMRDKKRLTEEITGLLYKYFIEEKDEDEHYNQSDTNKPHRLIMFSRRDYSPLFF